MLLVHHLHLDHCHEFPLQLAVCLVAALLSVEVELKLTRLVEFFSRSTFLSLTLFTGVTTSSTKITIKVTPYSEMS